MVVGIWSFILIQWSVLHLRNSNRLRKNKFGGLFNMDVEQSFAYM